MGPRIVALITAVSVGLVLLPGVSRADSRDRLVHDHARLARVLDQVRGAQLRVASLDERRRVIGHQLGQERLKSGVVETSLFKELAVERPRARKRLALARGLLDRLRGEVDRLRTDIAELRVRLSRLFQYCPVDPPRSFVDDFGVISRHGEPHVHMGVDIHAPVGTPVRAPFTGIAVVATNPVGGLAVKVFGAAGFVYQAHLSGIGKIGPVEDGEIVGYVGNTGDARYTQPHDHFEWHPGEGTAVDPYAELVSACD